MRATRRWNGVPLVLSGALVAAATVACSTATAGAGCGGGRQSYVSPDGTIRLIPVHCRVPAPDIHGETLDGTTYDVADDLGRVVVINLWGSWCNPCRAEQTTLNAVYDATNRLGVRFIGIDIQDTTVNANAFRLRHHVAYSSIVDKYQEIPLQFDPRLPSSPPWTVVLDRRGRLAARILGSSPKGVLEPIVRQLAAEKP